MKNIKKAALGLKARPSCVGNITKWEFESKKTGSFPNKTPKADSITIKKNDDYDKLPF